MSAKNDLLKQFGATTINDSASPSSNKPQATSQSFLSDLDDASQASLELKELLKDPYFAEQVAQLRDRFDAKKISQETFLEDVHSLFLKMKTQNI